MSNIRVLDCTLRDGGYINDWNFGNKIAKNIITCLNEAKVDLIEVGFLKNCENNLDYTVYNSINELKKILPPKSENTEYVAMILHSSYNIEKLEICDGTVPYIRVTFHDYDINEGLAFCEKVKEKGYKLFVNPINLMGYSDEKLIDLISKINLLHPYGFSIVDTFGSMTKRDLVRIYSICEHNLCKDIVFGLHLHENMSMAFSLAQNFLEIVEPKRSCVIDGSLNGMGRVPGNLCLELMLDYLNQYYEKQYVINSILDAVENYIFPIKKNSSWGYSTEYFLSAKNNMHRNYAEFFYSKGRLTAKAMNIILESIPQNKRSKFDPELSQKLFIEYQDKHIDDDKTIKYLKKYFAGREVLGLAPGKSIDIFDKKIGEFVSENNPIIVCAGFIYDKTYEKICFFSNEKRYQEYKNSDVCKVLTSNIRENNEEKAVIDYHSVAFSNGDFFDNCGIMMLRMLKRVGVKNVTLAGFDGFSIDGNDYAKGYHGEFVSGKKEENEKISNEMLELQKDMKISFLTPSSYLLKKTNI